MEIGPRDAVLVFTHDPKLDVPAVQAALATEAGYIGALGSRRTTADRNRRLRDVGRRRTSRSRASSLPAGWTSAPRRSRRPRCRCWPRSSRTGPAATGCRCARPRARSATPTPSGTSRPDVIVVGAGHLRPGDGVRADAARAQRRRVRRRRAQPVDRARADLPHRPPLAAAGRARAGGARALARVGAGARRGTAAGRGGPRGGRRERAAGMRGPRAPRGGDRARIPHSRRITPWEEAVVGRARGRLRICARTDALAAPACRLAHATVTAVGDVVRTAAGELAAGAVVVCAGIGTPALVRRDRPGALAGPATSASPTSRARRPPA